MDFIQFITHPWSIALVFIVFGIAIALPEEFTKRAHLGWYIALGGVGIAIFGFFKPLFDGLKITWPKMTSENWIMLYVSIALILIVSLIQWLKNRQSK